MRTIKTTTISILAVGLLAGSAVGVMAQDEEAEAGIISFTGVFYPDGEELPVEGTEEALANGLMVGDPGFAWLDRMESSDPRLTGDHRVIANWVIGPDGFDAWGTGGEPNLILSSIHELTNDGGSWLGEGVSFSSTELDLASGEIVTFVGRDGYEGLTAYALIDGTYSPARFSGVIFPAPMPETPEPYVAD